MSDLSLGRKFNANDVEPDAGGDYTPVPADWYPAILEASEKKETNDESNNDWYFNNTFTIVGDNYANRKVFDILNIGNSSEKAAEIAWRQLSAICHACEKHVIEDISELFNIPMEIKLKVVNAVMMPDGVTEKYKAKNEIVGYRPIGGAAPATNTAPAAQGQAQGPVVDPAPAANGGAAPKAKMPWEK